jgi:hypothetical protein
MPAGEQYPGGPDAPGATGVASPPRQLRRRAGLNDPRQRPARRRWWAAAWIGGGLALFAFLLRISLSSPITSDPANNALQAWDLLHGHVLLHGWIIGDATFYTFELPLYAITEILFGLHSVTVHLVSVLTYMIVVACCVALARTNSRGPSVAARCGVVVAVLAAPLVTNSGVGLLLEKPNHFGTSAFLVGSFLLIDRAPGRRFTSPLLCAILCAGQLGDATVRYIAVPTILVVCAYRVLAARKIRTGDTAIAVAAAASVPVASLIRAVMLRFGAYSMVPPKTGISPVGQWPHHALLTLTNVRVIFGAAADSGTALDVAGAVFGLACLLAAASGFAKVVWTWRTASRAEQLVCVAVVVNLAAYVVSTMPTRINAHDIVGLLPFGAVLAARACVPGHIGGTPRARVALTAAAIVALLPLAAAASRPAVTPPAAPLAAWLEAHGFTYGIAGYWNASAVTLQSGNQVQVRAVTKAAGEFSAMNWETRTDWYYPSRHDATFVIADPAHTHGNHSIPAWEFERYFGRPSATHWVAGRKILVYRTNLLERVAAACFSGSRRSCIGRRPIPSEPPR